MKKVKIGHIGLGRLGLRHAENIATKLENAELVALCDVDEKRLNEVADRLNVPNRYTSVEELVKCDELDALVICSPSGMHTEQIRLGLEAGLHVFSEKPLGITVEECKAAEKVVEAHKDKVFMLGFMRRFDPSYRWAKELVDSGEIGRPVLFRAYSQDPEKCIEGSIAFAAHSGGGFLDMAVHDIDLARWFIGSEVDTAWAIGGCYAHKEFAKYGDGDNLGAMLKFKDDTMGFLLAGRTAPHGYNIETEIIGTKKTIRIGSVPQKNLVEILDDKGVRKLCSEDFLERFAESYVEELRVFADCIINNKKPDVTVYDGTKVLEIANGCKESFETGELYKF